MIFGEDPADNPDATPLFSGEFVTGPVEIELPRPAAGLRDVLLPLRGAPDDDDRDHRSAEGGGEGGGGGGGGTTVMAKDLAFDTDQIDLAGRTPTTLTFDNKDAGIPHNIAIYTDDSLSETLFQGEQFPGIATRGLPDPGARCGDVLLPLRRPPHDERLGGGRSRRGWSGGGPPPDATGAPAAIRLIRSLHRC